MYAIKVELTNTKSREWSFESQKTMYGGKNITKGSEVFVFASENEGGVGLVAAGVTTVVHTIPRKVGVERQSPRVSVSIRRTATAKSPLGRAELRLYRDWRDGQPETEQNFKLYRQATNKLVGLSPAAAEFLRRFF
jgi:hypothetical protein